MLVGLLCNMKNGTSIFVQKLIGYVVFTGGLRAKATDLLCSLGVSCSSSTLDNEAKYWAENRDPLKELDKTKTWRISFDNLDFKRKFAKTFHYGLEACGRMLNLITSQVTHNAENKERTNRNISQKKTITEEDFFFSKILKLITHGYSLQRQLQKQA